MTVYTFPREALNAPAASVVSGVRNSRTVQSELLLLPNTCGIPKGFEGLILSLSPTLTKKQARSGAYLLPADLGEKYPVSFVYITSHISGGSLHQYLSENLQKYHERLFFIILPLHHRFLLPCPDGAGTALSEAESRELQMRTTVHDSEEFQCRCCFAEEQSRAWVYLFDDENTIRKKTELAEKIGISHCVVFM